MSTTYRINEVFYSLQGEGVRAGTTNIFIRFSGCNLACDMKEGPKSPGGFACDTEFSSGRAVTLEELEQWCDVAIKQATRDGGADIKSIILTGGEPGLQVDKDLIDYFHNRGFYLAIETNGTIKLPPGLDWITLSPKVAEHAVKQLVASELKYVRAYGQGIPKPAASAQHYLISPAFDGDQAHKETLQWCINLCLQNPTWRLSMQQHKSWKVR